MPRFSPIGFAPAAALSAQFDQTLCVTLSARQRRVADIPESGLPIRVYKDQDTWHVDFGDGVIEDHTTEEEATSAADGVAEAEERTVVVEE
jgi:hypothetical protein